MKECRLKGLHIYIIPFIGNNCPRKSKTVRTENRSVVIRGWARGGGGGGWRWRSPELLVVMKLSDALIVAVVTQLDTCINTNWTVHHQGQILLCVYYTLSNKLSPSKLVHGRKKVKLTASGWRRPSQSGRGSRDPCGRWEWPVSWRVQETHVCAFVKTQGLYVLHLWVLLYVNFTPKENTENKSINDMHVAGRGMTDVCNSAWNASKN